jgi:acetyltransferase-like isoleucine patch superfamily enzyme
VKAIAKRCVQAIFLCLALPPALLAGFGRAKFGFEFFAQALALVPGIVGDYLRVAFYRLTLTGCPLDWRIQFGSYFAHPQVTVGRHVYIGSYCVLGMVDIGDRTHIATAVQVLSGAHQHARDNTGMIDLKHGTLARVTIGADCWLGAGAIVMASIGERSTIGAGSVVVREIPAGSVAVGAPARVVTGADADRVDTPDTCASSSLSAGARQDDDSGAGH